MIIRSASLNDLDTLLRFEQGVISAERPFDPTLKDDYIRYYDIEGLIAAPHVELLVTELDSELIGCGYARIETSKQYLQHAQHAYVGFMYVEPEHRGKGIGGKILDALKEWSRSRNVTEMRLEVYDENLAAIRAYEKAGFSRHVLEMRVGLI
jgi:ribosomal protein S18 acetylase RimI-like enzyme